MAEDFYELLEIPDNANEVWIRRAYHTTRESLLQDTTLNEGRRQSRIAAVEDAFSILSNPATRHVYDRDRLKLPEPEPTQTKSLARRMGITSARVTIWGITALLVIGASWAYWRYAKEGERLHLEQERSAAEVAARVRDIEARDKARRASIEKIASSIERRQASESLEHLRIRPESSESGKSDGDEVNRELARIQVERALAEQARRDEASKRIQKSIGM